MQEGILKVSSDDGTNDFAIRTMEIDNVPFLFVKYTDSNGVIENDDVYANTVLEGNEDAIFKRFFRATEFTYEWIEPLTEV